MQPIRPMLLRFADTTRISQLASDRKDASGFVSVSQSGSIRLLHISAKAPNAKDTQATELLRESLVTLVCNELVASEKWSRRKASDIQELAQRAVADVWRRGPMNVAGLVSLNGIACALAQDRTGLSSIDGKAVADAFSEQLSAGTFSLARPKPEPAARPRASACNRLMSPLYTVARTVAWPVTATLGGISLVRQLWTPQSIAVGHFREAFRIRSNPQRRREAALARDKVRGSLVDVTGLSGQERVDRLLGGTIRGDLSRLEARYSCGEWLHVIDLVGADWRAAAVAAELISEAVAGEEWGVGTAIGGSLLTCFHPSFLKDVFFSKDDLSRIQISCFLALESGTVTADATLSFAMALGAKAMGGLSKSSIVAGVQEFTSTQKGESLRLEIKAALDILTENSMRYEAFRRSGIASDPKFDGMLIGDLVHFHETTEKQALAYVQSLPEPVELLVEQPYPSEGGVDEIERRPESPPSGLDSKAPAVKETGSDADSGVTSPPAWKDRYVRQDRPAARGRASASRRSKAHTAVPSSTTGSASARVSPSASSSSSLRTTAVTTQPPTGRTKRRGIDHHDLARNKAAPKWLRDRVGRPGKKWNHAMAIRDDFSVKIKT